MSNELLPCPFCGGDAVCEMEGTHAWGIWCEGCDAHGSCVHFDEANARKGWNRRIPPAAQANASREMIVPKSIYNAFRGKEQEAWLHGYQTAFARYATPSAPPAVQPVSLLSDAEIDDWIITLAVYDIAGATLRGRERISNFAKAIEAAVLAKIKGDAA